jgi:uncharacterized protein YbjT (DUF2867 family)
VPVWTFENADDVRATWGSLDDVVMGGVSRSNVEVHNGDMVFSGMLSVSNSGGFASTRSVDFSSPIDLSAFDGVTFRVKGDGKRYKFIIRCDGKWDGLSYCHSFDTVANEWTDIKIPFRDFEPAYRARRMPNSAPLNSRHITALQIMLSKFEYDGELNPKFSPGDFELRVQTIRAYAKPQAERAYAKFVHLGTSGATRPLRQGEPDLVKAPIEDLNESLGNILNWKLAGEDAVRSAQGHYGYVIVRPTGLTVDESVGLDALKICQGDNIVGLVSRDDCARLLVEALYDANVVNKTFEVARVNAGAQKPSTSFSEQVKGLRADRMENRKFASFPYVPK